MNLKWLNSELLLVIIDIAVGSMMSFLGIITYGKTKKPFVLFFVITGIFLYINMVVRVLDGLNLFQIDQIDVLGLPIAAIREYLPMLAMSIGFILLLKEK